LAVLEKGERTIMTTTPDRLNDTIVAALEGLATLSSTLGMATREAANLLLVRDAAPP
jgi:hypothetical protein